MNYWLFKTEPDEYSIDDLKNEPSGKAFWDGIRNYQARNYLRDEVRLGDKVFIYHSSCNTVGIAGTGTVVRKPSEDPTQFDKESHYYDAKSSPENPRWYGVEIAFEKKFPEVISLKKIKTLEPLSDMVLLKNGRLSIQPVTKKQWTFINKLSRNE